MAETGSYREAEDYCLSRSWRLRTRKKDSRRLIRWALARIPPKSPVDTKENRKKWKRYLRDELETNTQVTYGSSLVIFLILKILLPIVIQLVLQWWFSRKAK